jgi:hypothetical protein
MPIPRVIYNKHVTSSVPPTFGPTNTFENTFQTLLTNCVGMDIVSGYVDYWSGFTFGPSLVKKAKSGHRIRILIGRAEKEGLAQKTINEWAGFDTQLRTIDPDNGLYAPLTSIHAKVYIFYMEANQPVVYVGSSNFSRTGLYQWMECIAEPVASEITNIANFIDNLFDPALLIDFNQIQAKGSSTYKTRWKQQSLQNLRTHKIKPNTTQLAKWPLTLIDLHPYAYPNAPISSLNLFFSSGRKNQNATYSPRPWYEIELTLGMNRFPSLPRDFDAYTDDGFIIPMQRRSGAPAGQSHRGLKDLTSKNKREVFGEWLKGRLEKTGALTKGHIIDASTFHSFGSHTLNFYDMGSNNFYMSFKPPTTPHSSGVLGVGQSSSSSDIDNET